MKHIALIVLTVLFLMGGSAWATYQTMQPAAPTKAKVVTTYSKQDAVRIIAHKVAKTPL